MNAPTPIERATANELSWLKAWRDTALTIVVFCALFIAVGGIILVTPDKSYTPVLEDLTDD